MSITYGFFNSVDGDRTYDADQMSEYFNGLVSDGVYENVDGALQVKAVSGGGMTVIVEAGRGIINCKWINNNASLVLEVSPAHATLPRYTAVVMKLDNVNRLMTITTKDGTPASSPVVPSLQNDSYAKELMLAYIYVGAGATSISQANITDMRASSSCGWITGLIRQVDTSTLFLQYQTAYANMLTQMQSWQTQMESDFTDWLETLTEDLNVNTWIQKFTKTATITNSSVISLDMTGYTYDTADIISVYVNGLYDDSYTLSTSGNTPTITVAATASGTVVDIVILKSRIGFNVLGGSDGSAIVDPNNNEIDIT